MNLMWWRKDIAKNELDKDKGNCALLSLFAKVEMTPLRIQNYMSSICLQQIFPYFLLTALHSFPPWVFIK